MVVFHDSQKPVGCGSRTQGPGVIGLVTGAGYLRWDLLWYAVCTGGYRAFLKLLYMRFRLVAQQSTMTVSRSPCPLPMRKPTSVLTDSVCPCRRARACDLIHGSSSPLFCQPQHFHALACLHGHCPQAGRSLKVVKLARALVANRAIVRVNQRICIQEGRSL